MRSDPLKGPWYMSHLFGSRPIFAPTVRRVQDTSNIHRSRRTPTVPISKVMCSTHRLAATIGVQLYLRFVSVCGFDQKYLDPPKHLRKWDMTP